MLKNINESNIQKMYTAITHFHERKKSVAGNEKVG